MTCLCVKSTSECNLIKPLYENGDALKKKDSLGSSEIVERRLPSSDKNECPASLIGPSVSIAIGTNRWHADRSAYFETFLSAAACAALPVTWALTATWEGANVSATVASQVKQRPPCYSTSASPSGRLSSPGNKPDGSLIDGVSALRTARQSRSLICWWRMERPALCFYESPCMHLTSTTPPQGKEWGSQIFSPKRRPIAILTASLLMRRPQAESGKAKIHSLPWSAFTANSLALLISDVRCYYYYYYYYYYMVLAPISGRILSW